MQIAAIVWLSLIIAIMDQTFTELNKKNLLSKELKINLGVLIIIWNVILIQAVSKEVEDLMLAIVDFQVQLKAK